MAVDARGIQGVDGDEDEDLPGEDVVRRMEVGDRPAQLEHVVAPGEAGDQTLCRLPSVLRPGPPTSGHAQTLRRRQDGAHEAPIRANLLLSQQSYRPAPRAATGSTLLEEPLLGSGGDGATRIEVGLVERPAGNGRQAK